MSVYTLNRQRRRIIIWNVVNDLSQAVYYAATGNFKLVVNWKKSNEIKVLMIWIEIAL